MIRLEQITVDLNLVYRGRFIRHIMEIPMRAQYVLVKSTLMH